jgi:hypothetical protein
MPILQSINEIYRKGLRHPGSSITVTRAVPHIF